MRHHTTEIIDSLDTFKNKVIKYCEPHKYSCVLDSNQMETAKGIGDYEFIAAFGCADKIELNTNCFDGLQTFYEEKKDWIFGGLSYELKEELHGLSSQFEREVKFPNLFFFQPKTVVYIKKGELTTAYFSSLNHPFSWNIKEEGKASKSSTPIFDLRMSKDVYLEKVGTVINQIEEGTFYELNLCQEFVAKDANIQPIEVFAQLKEQSPTPFSAYLRWNSSHLISASPERYLHKKGNKVTSQPIKGTKRRSESKELDDALKLELQGDEKERAENVMIVDLVRNDLARSCKHGSVKAEELFGIYSFNYVHQMVSTVSGTLESSCSWLDAIKNSFPMGSMTGAPKVEVMKWINELEVSGRGLYSGSVGYVNPEGDFDFSVIIRSLLYDEESHILSYHVGGAITYDSIPENEYNECLLKASAIKKVF